MNKNVSLAIEKAVGSISQKNQIYFLYLVKQNYFKMKKALQLRLTVQETQTLQTLEKKH